MARRAKIGISAIVTFLLTCFDWWARFSMLDPYLSSKQDTVLGKLLADALNLSPWVLLAVALAFAVWWIITPANDARIVASVVADRPLPLEQPQGTTGIRAVGIHGLQIYDSKFEGLNTAMDIKDSHDVDLQRNSITQSPPPRRVESFPHINEETAVVVRPSARLPETLQQDVANTARDLRNLMAPFGKSEGDETRLYQLFSSQGWHARISRLQAQIEQATGIRVVHLLPDKSLSRSEIEEVANWLTQVIPRIPADIPTK